MTGGQEAEGRRESAHVHLTCKGGRSLEEEGTGLVQAEETARARPRGAHLKPVG